MAQIIAIEDLLLLKIKNEVNMKDSYFLILMLACLGCQKRSYHHSEKNSAPSETKSAMQTIAREYAHYAQRFNLHRDPFTTLSKDPKTKEHLHKKAPVWQIPMSAKYIQQTKAKADNLAIVCLICVFMAKNS